VNRIPYGPEEDEIIRRLWPVNTGADVGALIERTPSSVDNRAQKLGLRKDPAYVVANSARFRAGQDAWNRGVKGSTGNHPNTRRTQFKKGELQGAARHNYVPIGSHRISKDGYLEQKVTDDPALYPARRWVAVHRLVWEAVNGPVPPGHAVVFRPGRHTNEAAAITADGLELVSRGDLMRRNSYHTRYPKEVAQLIQLRGALNRKLNRRQKEANP
jgi:hypothetical protein